MLLLKPAHNAIAWNLKQVCTVHSIALSSCAVCNLHLDCTKKSNRKGKLIYFHSEAKVISIAMLKCQNSLIL